MPLRKFKNLDRTMPTTKSKVAPSEPISPRRRIVANPLKPGRPTPPK